MHSFKEFSQLFEEKFNLRHFPSHPANLYDASQYLLTMEGKRIRPVLCLMGNELFDDLKPQAYHVAAAVELFHNFTLVHDDIMDKAPLRRGVQTVHEKYGESTALLAGDVILVTAYEYLNKVGGELKRKVISLFNEMAKKVCEGQQLDMEFAQKQVKMIASPGTGGITFDDYAAMIELKTSVLLGTSLCLGAVLGMAGLGNQEYLYEFGKNLGMAFQVQDDYLDIYGDPGKFGKQPGGDILSNKKTFLLIHALQSGSDSEVEELKALMESSVEDKVQRVVAIYNSCRIQEWAMELKNKYMSLALQNLEETAVLSFRKKPLEELAHFLLDREK
ncbi:MAG: polyprenyl synthetase family protein [Ginsengibacter sp.]